MTYRRAAGSMRTALMLPVGCLSQRIITCCKPTSVPLAVHLGGSNNAGSMMSDARCEGPGGVQGGGGPRLRGRRPGGGAGGRAPSRLPAPVHRLRRRHLLPRVPHPEGAPPPPPSIPQLPPPWDTTTPPQGQLQPMNSEVRMKGSSDTLSEVQRTTENDLHAVQAKVALMVKKAGHSVLCIGDGGGPLACPSCRASYASVALPLLLC